MEIVGNALKEHKFHTSKSDTQLKMGANKQEKNVHSLSLSHTRTRYALSEINFTFEGCVLRMHAIKRNMVKLNTIECEINVRWHRHTKSIRHNVEI